MRFSASLFQQSTLPRAVPYYVFYDLETSGLSETFDQILQFAAIITDKNFNVLKEYNIRVKLRPDVIPHPKALLITQISPEQLASGETEFQAIRKIFEIINLPGTISLGFNSLKFDDQFLRFSFHRHLLPPYKHQWDNGCHRMDIFPIVLMAHHFYPGILKWPVVDGKVSFKLEHLVRENNISTGVSHDALVDVRDTIALTKLLSRNSELWERVAVLFDKKKDEENISTSPNPLIVSNNRHELGFMMDVYPTSPIIPVLNLGKHKSYNNQTRWLRLDKMLSKEIKSASMTLTKRYGEPPFFFPSSDQACRDKFSDEAQSLVDDNIRWITENPEFFSGLVEHHLGSAYSNTPNVDAYSSLYQLGFPKPDVEHMFDAFHKIEPERKLEVALRLPHATYQELAVRILGMHLPETIQENPNDSDDVKRQKQYAREKYENHLKKLHSEEPVIDFHGEKRITITAALVSAREVLSNAREKHLIRWYEEKYVAMDPRRRTRKAVEEMEDTSPTGVEPVFSP